MPGQYDHVRSGQPLRISAAAWNDMLTMLSQWKGSQSSLVGATPSTGGVSQTTIRIKNTTGATVPRFSVLQIDEPVIDPTGGEVELQAFKNTVAMQGIEPDITSGWGKFCITLTPIPDGLIGEAVISGVVPVKINVRQSGHQWADIKDGDSTQLDSDDCGTCKVLWVEPGTGSSKWSLVCLGESQMFAWAVTQEDIDAGATGDIKFSNVSGTTFGSTLDGTWLADEGTIASGSLVIRIRDNLLHRWVILPFSSSGGNTTVEGYLDGDLAAGGTATLSVWDKHTLIWADTGTNVTVEDRAGWAADSGSYCMAVEMGTGDYRPVVLGCPS